MSGPQILAEGRSSMRRTALMLAGLTGLVSLVAVDALWLHGLLFGTRWWRICQWALSALGLGIGAFAYVMRGR